MEDLICLLATVRTLKGDLLQYFWQGSTPQNTHKYTSRPRVQNFLANGTSMVDYFMAYNLSKFDGWVLIGAGSSYWNEYKL